ncbi:MAG TPA: DUF4136 domain-containing protein [Cyclobacteriaceae bacterium]|nr:DUF4136 domain-containing protein [Cyclobacteriaceae bacterium]
MMNRLLCFVCFAFCTTYIPSLGQKVSADYDSKTDWKQYKTYAWLAPGDSVLNRYRVDKLYGGTITYAGNLELRNRGMKIDTLKPDLIIIFDTMVNNFTEYKQGATLSVGVAVAGPGYYVGGSAPVAGGKITEYTVTGGVLVFAMYDTKTLKLIWTGRAEKKFSMADDIPKMINYYTKLIFKKLPIKNK